MKVTVESEEGAILSRFGRAVFAGGLVLALLLPVQAGAGEKTEKFWNDLNRKYANESLVCLLDNIQFSMEYTGETVKRDATEMASFGDDARTSGFAIGSTFLTSARWEKTYAVFDQVAAARFQEWVVPLASGETTVRTRIEVVDRDGKMVDVLPEAVSVRTALPEAPELYSYIKELVFSVPDIPVPCVVKLFYTIEGENEFGHLNRVFSSEYPTYRMELVYNLPNALQAQFPWVGTKTLRSQRTDALDEGVNSVVTPQGSIQQFSWGQKNMRARAADLFQADAVVNSPRVSVAPNFESEWVKLLDWYGGGVNQVLNTGGNDVVLRPIIREICADLETDADKAKAIYRFIQDRYNVIPMQLGRDGYLPNRPVDVAELDSVTPCDLALLMVALLRSAGLEAGFGITSSVERGQVNQNIIALHQFSDPVVLLDLDGETHVIDPTSRTAGIYNTPAAFENNLVLRIEAGEPDWIEVNPSSPSENKVNMSGTLEMGEDGKYTVSQTVEYLGEQGTEFRNRFYANGAGPGQAAREEWLSRNLPEGSMITAFDQDRGESNDDPYTVVFDMECPLDLIEDSGDTISIAGAVFGQLVPSQVFNLDPESRQNAILLGYPEAGQQQTSIRIPDGYEVNSRTLPEQFDSTFEFGRLSMSYRKTVFQDAIYDTTMVEDSLVIEEVDFTMQDGVIYTMSYELNPEMNRIPVENAAALVEFFNLFQRNRESRVVLAKKVEEFVGQR